MRQRFFLALFVAGTLPWATPAQAHVKWFAPYIVGAPPAPIWETLGDAWFWLGIAMVLACFIATRLIELRPIGETILTFMDRFPLRSGRDWMTSFAA